jgi:hypothetical protein
MNKYILEGGFDFYKDLLNDDQTEVDHDDKCLITNAPLVDKHVTMNCGHKFNYIPLYHDVSTHKKKFNGMESGTSSLKVDEIRCPYCRTKQTGVLPYYEEFGLAKVNGVNVYIPYVPPPMVKCQYLSPNAFFEPELPEDDFNFTYTKCSNYGSQISGNCYGDANWYCYHHKKIVIRKCKTDLKIEVKAEKAAKLAANEKAKLESEQIAQSIEQMTQHLDEYTKLHSAYTNSVILGKQKMLGCIDNMRKLKKGCQPTLEHLSPSIDYFDIVFSDFTTKMSALSHDIAKIHDGYIQTASNSENVVVVSNIQVDTVVPDTPMGCVEIIKSGKNKGVLCYKNVFVGNLCKVHHKFKYKA